MSIVKTHKKQIAENGGNYELSRPSSSPVLDVSSTTRRFCESIFWNTVRSEGERLTQRIDQLARSDLGRVSQKPINIYNKKTKL
jgi:hypothetical protein